MKKKTIVLILLCAGLALGAAGCNWHHKGHGKMMEHVMKKVSSELDLTGAQQAKLEEIKTVFLEKHKAKKETHKGKFDFLVQEVKKDTLDVELLEAKMDEHIAKGAEHRKFMLQKFAEFHAMLTTEQKVKLAALLEKHKDRFKKGHGRGHGSHW